MNVVFTPTAWQQYTDWQKEDKKIVKRINELIKSIISSHQTTHLKRSKYYVQSERVHTLS